MKLGFYGGTFDPIHNGHLILARDAVESLGLDRLFFVPNTISPHKLGSQPAPANLRAEMIRAAIADEPRFDIEESELQREGTSFTIDTILAMRERYGPESRFFYLIGQDNVKELHTWRRIDELRQQVQFVVLSRNDAEGPPAFPTLNRRIDISATEIRNRIANNASIRYFVPEQVYELLIRHHLYQS
jgi:nicotinate-nucleotide adenylyltransferase